MCNTVGSKGLTLWDVTVFLVSSKMNWSSSKKTLADISSLTIMHRLCCRLSGCWTSLLSFGCDTFFWCLFFLNLSVSTMTLQFFFSTQSLKTYSLSACCSRLTAFVFVLLKFTTYYLYFYLFTGHQLLHNFSTDC